MSDVIVLKIKGDKRVLKAKLKKLTDSSPYFEAMFSQNFKEKPDNITILNVKEIMSFETLENLVKYAETGQVSFNVTAIEELLRAVDFFQMDQLKGDLSSHVKANVDHSIRMDNVMELWQKAQTDGSTELANAFEYHVLINFESLMYEPAFALVTVDQLKRLLGSDDLLISSEKVVVQAIKIWINYDYENRKDSLDELLPQMRFQRKVDIHFLRRDVQSYSNTMMTKQFLYAYEYYFKNSFRWGISWHKARPTVRLSYNDRTYEGIGVRDRRSKSLKY